MYDLQTHKEVEKKSQPGQTQSITLDEAILTAAAEPPPYGTVRAVGSITFLFVPFSL